MGRIVKGIGRAFLTAVLITITSAVSSFAQDGDPILGNRIWKGKADCRACHGWGAHGVQDDPQSPGGANLRATTLTPDEMAEVILCGRPGTEMPYFHRNGWTANFRCYGMVRREAAGMVPMQARPSLNEREVNGLVAYIFMDFVGKPQPTFEECQSYWGPDAKGCVRYPRQDGP